MLLTRHAQLSHAARPRPFDLDKEPNATNRLPSFIHCPDTGATIALRWKRAPPACNYCKRRGHHIDECDRRTRRTKHARANVFEPNHVVAPAEALTSPELPTPSTTNYTNPDKIPPELSDLSDLDTASDSDADPCNPTTPTTSTSDAPQATLDSDEDMVAPITPAPVPAPIEVVKPTLAKKTTTITQRRLHTDSDRIVASQVVMAAAHAGSRHDADPQIRRPKRRKQKPSRD